VIVHTLRNFISYYRPFWCLSGSEDRSIGVYSGAPFEFVKELQEHKNFVNDLRLSPSGSMFASGSSDRRIVLFDSKTTTKIKELVDEKNGHNGTIISLFWVSDDQLLTASLDKTCKLWDIKTSTVIYTMAAKKEKLEVEDMQAACGAFGNEIMFSITLNGRINIWKFSELNKDPAEINLPFKVIGGTESSITSLCYSHKNNFLVSGDSSGIISIWKDQFPRSNKIHKGTIVDLKEGIDGSIYVAGTYKMIFKVDDEANIKHTLNLEASPLGIAPSRVDASTIFVLLDNGNLIKIIGDTIKEVYKVSKDSTCLEINNDDSEIYIGDKKGVIHIYNAKDMSEISTLTEYKYEITCIVYHLGSKRLAATDKHKLLYIYDMEKKVIVGNPMSGHSGAVWKCGWSPNGEYIATSSLDFSVTVWYTGTMPCQKINIERTSLFIV